MFEAVEQLFVILGITFECPPTMQTLLPWFLKVMVGIGILASLLNMFKAMAMYFTSGGRRLR